MIPIRYAKAKITDQEQIDSFIHQTHVGHLGLSDGTEPYVIPLNFCWLHGHIYFHGADAGRKVDIIAANNRVCFCISEERGTIADPVPAHTSTAFMSVMLFGKVERVEEPAEMRDAMQAMLDKYVPGYFSEPVALQHVLKYRSSMKSPTAVFRITPDHVSAKGQPMPADKKFYPGRTQQMDR